MHMPPNLIRRAAAILLFATFVSVIVFTARLEGMAASSPKRRSDIALRQAVNAEMTAKEIRSYIREIAAADPMHAVGFFLEVMALDQDKVLSMDARRALIAEASRRQPSFAAPRIWMTADDIRNERFAQAVDGADTVMRLNGEFRTLLIPILTPLLTNDEAFPLLEKKLKTFPIWRTQFLSEAIKAGVSEPRVERLLRHSSPSRYAEAMTIERSAYLQSLVARGETLRARKVWQSFMPEHAKAAIFDSDFRAKYPLFPFAWRYASDDYSYAEKVSTTDGSDTLIRAHHGGDGKVALVTQLVALKSGSNLVTITTRDGGLAKPAKLFWRIRCFGASDAIASQSLAKLGGDWQKLQIQIAVPETGCALQYLSLEAEDNDGDEAEVEIRRVEAR